MTRWQPIAAACVIAGLSACGEAAAGTSPTSLPVQRTASSVLTDPSPAVTGPPESIPPESTTPESAATTLPQAATIDGEWMLVSGRIDGVELTLLDRYEITLRVVGTEISGTAACNSYDANASFIDGSVVFSDIFVTAMGCEPGAMDLEQRFVGGLFRASSYAVDRRLSLFGDGVELLFERVEPVAAPPIVGSNWVLNTILDPTLGVAWTSPDFELVTLTFHDDGTLQGTTACRGLHGGWNADQSDPEVTSIVFIDNPAAGVCAPEALEIDRQIELVLNAVFVITVENGQMGFRTDHGNALIYINR
jgi:heat shock protein HslJ